MIIMQILGLKKVAGKGGDTLKVSPPFSRSIILLLFLLVVSSCDDSSSPTLPTIEEESPEPMPTTDSPIAQEGTIAFYNVENLFDTEDDPSNPRDNEFLPNAEKEWTAERYAHKLDNIGKVMEGVNFPIIMGLAEVENQQVLEDLLEIEALANHAYQIVHKESPDFRGIDVALLYQADHFTLTDWETYTIQIDDPIINNFTTRDILRVSGELFNSPIHIFVNHWPSRSGGATATEFRRITVANELSTIVKDLQATLPEANILLMGDFNDEPTNKSILEVLAAQPLEEERDQGQLYNCTTPLDRLGEGSFNFQGDWQMIDQIMATGNLLNTQNTWSLQNFQVYSDPTLLFTHPEYGLSPDRTYGGDVYFGGFSDHLPIFMEIIVQ